MILRPHDARSIVRGPHRVSNFMRDDRLIGAADPGVSEQRVASRGQKCGADDAVTGTIAREEEGD